jgi:hypothetical protein
MTREVVKIGGASGFWGDTALAVPQLLGAELDYLVFDYLAEVTMSILAAQRAKDPDSGYATDFVQIMMREALPTLKQRGIRVVANAGGVNPLACRDALLALAGELGIALKVGVVLGDDLRARADEFTAAGVTEMFSGATFPKRVASINAYLGAFPIARALDAGCDVVITGRCVDSAVTLGVLIHEFGWTGQQFDLLAQGTLAGHLIECGAQGTGGLFTDWEQVPDWENIGFPISATFADGYRNTGFLTIAGEQAAAKAHRTGRALLARMSAMLAARGLPPFSETRIEVLGAEDMYGAHARPDAREVVLKLAAKSTSKDSLELFAREFAPAATSMAPGTLGLVGGRPSPTPVVRLFSFLWPKRKLTIEIDVQGERSGVALAPGEPLDLESLPPARRHIDAATAPTSQMLPLVALAHGRSGDKGDKANIGIVSRRPEHLAWLSAWLTPERVAAHFAHRAPSKVERFDLPGVGAINFVLHDVLGGGGMASLHTDNLAKAYAQVLLAMDVPSPR